MHLSAHAHAPAHAYAPSPATQIMQHCKNNDNPVSGQLLGLDVGQTLEVTDCFPFPVSCPPACLCCLPAHPACTCSSSA